jgi:hypothetical protein
VQGQCLCSGSVSPPEIIAYLREAKFRWTFCEYLQPTYVAALGEPTFRENVQLRSANVAKGNERRTECIWTGGKKRNVTVTVRPIPDGRTQTFYTSLTVEQLLREIKDCIGSVEFSRNQMTREMRDRLLPALLELRKKTYRKKPGFYESLEKIGFNPNTVRMWFYRGHTGQEVGELLEPEEPQFPAKRESEDHPGESSLLEHCDRLATAVMDGKFIYARKLATQYIEARRG